MYPLKLTEVHSNTPLPLLPSLRVLLQSLKPLFKLHQSVTLHRKKVFILKQYTNVMFFKLSFSRVPLYNYKFCCTIFCFFVKKSLFFKRIWTLMYNFTVVVGRTINRNILIYKPHFVVYKIELKLCETNKTKYLL